ncbi:hypothetical protein CPB86DRAFT_761475 [Serendipita vermifera]|nr:hypothetical protein CPB86DRAFT_761475 [Serendipita vermifera]
MCSNNSFRGSYGSLKRQRAGVIRRLDADYPLDHYYGRPETVENLYSRLNEYRFILVRGPPGSGKTALSMLLDQYIRSKEENSIVFWKDAWPTDFWKQTDLSKFYPRTQARRRRVVFIIDEAQRTYSDISVWEEVFQRILAGYHDLGARVILFTSHGPVDSRITLREYHPPFIVASFRRVSLWAEPPLDISGNPVPKPPIGLFLSSLEVPCLISHILPSHRLDTSLYVWVFTVTAGHAGAIKDIVHFVSRIKSYQETEDGKMFTLQRFVETVPLEQLWNFLRTSDNFSRGVPSAKVLRHCRIRNLLETICVEEEVLYKTYGKKLKPLEYSHKKGWLHSGYQKYVGQTFFFPTPLHHWFTAFHLSRLDPIQPLETTPLAFVKRVFRQFSSERLFSIRRGECLLIKNQSEVNYRQEFYRVCGVSIVIFPEFVCGEGSTEFYIPSRKWAIKLLHEGSDVEDSFGQFSFEHYKKCIPVEDYIVLDCRRSTPKTAQTDHRYYHVVFKDVVRILNHKVAKVDSFQLGE